MGPGVGDRAPSQGGYSGTYWEVTLGQRLEGEEAASTGSGERSFLGRRKACAKAPRSGCARSFPRKRERTGGLHVEATVQGLTSLEKFTLERFEGLLCSTEG